MNLKLEQFAQKSKFTIRTSDRRVFRRCMRKWNHMSSLRKNLKHKGTEQNINFWFGSAIHFAMEDFHGWNRFGDPRRAFHAYYKAFPENEWPNGAEMHYELGMAMLSYYLTWYEKHNERSQFETIWFDEHLNVVEPFTEGAMPGVEQSFYIPLDVYVVAAQADGHIFTEVSQQLIEDLPEMQEVEFRDLGTLSVDFRPMVDGDNIVQQPFYFWTDLDGVIHNVDITPIMYHGTMDRLVKDCMGRWWILDYKTAKGADTNKLDTDDQVSAYLWAAEKWFGHKIYGFVYLQLTKDMVQEPKRLKNGELSVDKRQKTTYSLLKAQIINDYGSVNAAPNKVIDFLNVLAEAENEEGDRFIRWDLITRNDNQLVATENHIRGELAVMLNPFLYAYPSPTRDCIWDCPIRDMCLAMDRGDEELIATQLLSWEPRPRSEDGNIEPWRENLKWPESPEDLIPMDEIINAEMLMTIELDSLSDDTSGFQFMYEEDC